MTDDMESQRERLSRIMGGKSGGIPADASDDGPSHRASGLRPRRRDVETADEEDHLNTWDDTGYRATDDEAHRNVTYNIPPMMNQTITMFMVQMRLFAKEKWTYLMIVVALAIPVAVLAAHDTIVVVFSSMFMTSLEFSNGFIAGCLSMMPLLMGLFTSITCGTQIPSEFKNRTAYMNISLPMSRTAFYFGKYLAGFVLSLAIFVFAYGMALATSTMYYDEFFTDLLTESLLFTVVAVFVYTSTAFCIGCFMRRGSSMVPFILMAIVLPGVAVLVSVYTDTSTLMSMPFFLCEGALGILGAGGSASAGLIGIDMMDMTSMWTMVGIGLVWGILFLALGLVKTKRREM